MLATSASPIVMITVIMSVDPAPPITVFHDNPMLSAKIAGSAAVSTPVGTPGVSPDAALTPAATPAADAGPDVSNDPDAIEIDFIESKISDHSGVEAVRNIANKYLWVKSEMFKDPRVTQYAQIKTIPRNSWCKCFPLKQPKTSLNTLSLQIQEPQELLIRHSTVGKLNYFPTYITAK